MTDSPELAVINGMADGQMVCGQCMQLLHLEMISWATNWCIICTDTAPYETLVARINELHGWGSSDG